MPKFWSCSTTNKNNDRISKQIDARLKRDEKVYKATYRLLVLGDNESEEQKTIRQMAFLYNSRTEQENIDKIPEIKRIIRDSLTCVLRAFDVIVPPIQLENPQNQWRATYILTTAHQSDFDYPPEFYEHATILLADAGVRSCLERSHEYQLLDCAKYFLDRIHEIRRPDYIPSDQDLVRCHVSTSKVLETILTVERIRFHLIDMRGQRSERRKWMQCFNDVAAIIFTTNCSNFDLMLSNDGCQNELQASIDRFKTIWDNKWLQKISFLLLLSGEDLLAEKMKSGHRLEDHFPDFASYVVPPTDPAYYTFEEDSEVIRAKHFIRDQFLKIAMATTKDQRHYIIPYFTCTVDTDNIRRMLCDLGHHIQPLYLRYYELL